MSSRDGSVKVASVSSFRWSNRLFAIGNCISLFDSIEDKKLILCILSSIARGVKLMIVENVGVIDLKRRNICSHHCDPVSQTRRTAGGKNHE